MYRSGLYRIIFIYHLKHLINEHNEIASNISCLTVLLLYTMNIILLDSFGEKWYYSLFFYLVRRFCWRHTNSADKIYEYIEIYYVLALESRYTSHGTYINIIFIFVSHFALFLRIINFFLLFFHFCMDKKHRLHFPIIHT